MTLPVWPSDLPRPLRAGYQVAVQDGRFVTRQDSGATRLRRRFSNTGRLMSLTFLFTRNEKARFDNFYVHEASGGSLQFIMPDFADDGWVLTDDEGAPLTTDDFYPLASDSLLLCQFGTEPPVAEIAGLEWRVSLTIEVLP